MRWHSLAIIFGLALGGAGIASAAEKGDTCELGEALTLSARPNGKGKKRTAKAGDTAKVLKVNKKGMVRVKAGKAKGWVSGEAFDLACGGEDETMAVAPAEDDPMEDDGFSDPEPVGDEAGGDSMGDDPMDDSMEASDSEFGAGGDSMSDSSESSSDFGGSDSSSDSGAFGDTSSEDDFSSSSSSSDDFSSSSSKDDDAALLILGGGVAFGTESDLGFRGDVIVDLSPFVSNLRLNLNFIYYLDVAEGDVEGVSATAYGLNFDAQYSFLSLDDIDVYALAGFGIFNVSVSIDAADFSESNSENQINLGVGADWAGLGFADLFAEAKYALSLADVPEGADSLDQFVISLGLRFDVL
ncbi:MAG: outer membrane beta-barrel protein [Myxococcota bacterium]